MRIWVAISHKERMAAASDILPANMSLMVQIQTRPQFVPRSINTTTEPSPHPPKSLPPVGPHPGPPLPAKPAAPVCVRRLASLFQAAKTPTATAYKQNTYKHNLRRARHHATSGKQRLGACLLVWPHGDCSTPCAWQRHHCPCHTQVAHSLKSNGRNQAGKWQPHQTHAQWVQQAHTVTAQPPPLGERGLALHHSASACLRTNPTAPPCRTTPDIAGSPVVRSRGPRLQLGLL